MPKDTQLEGALDQLESAFGESLTNALRHLVDGAADDVRIYVEKLARLGVAAARENDQEMIAELQEQAKVLGEIQRIRLMNVQWHVIGDVVGGITQVLAAALRVGIV